MIHELSESLYSVMMTPINKPDILTNVCLLGAVEPQTLKFL